MNIIAGPMLQVYNQIAASSSSSSSSSNGNGSSAAAAASVVVSLKDELHVLEGQFSLSLSSLTTLFLSLTIILIFFFLLGRSCINYEQERAGGEC
jgi:hypothetical protein